MNLRHLLNFDWVSNPSAWVGLVTLVALEIVLGIDNIVFISILSGKLPKEDRKRGRKLGITLAVIPRLFLLLFLGIVLGLVKPLFHIPFVPDPENKAEMLGISGQDLIVIVGGLFLLWKATHEIHDKLEGENADDPSVATKPAASFRAVMVQIMVLNIVFSLDSIITAIGMIPKEQILVMMLAVIIATILMAVTINPVSKFVEKHPTVKMMALSFLLLIGMTLIAEGFHAHIPKGYVYFAMGFTVFVELLNLRMRKATHAVELRGEPHMPQDEVGIVGEAASSAPTTEPALPRPLDESRPATRDAAPIDDAVSHSR